MYYEINVALKGKHLFATAERSITTAKQLDFLVRKFQACFPLSEGYQITASECYKASRNIPVASILNAKL
jgi:hypothetical protein